MCTKTELRKQMKALRKTLCADFTAATERFFRTYGNRTSFFVYRSFSTEAETDTLLNRLLQAGKEVYLPRIDGENMVAVRWTGQALVKNAYGIFEPSGDAYEGELEVTVLPLLAADLHGGRLGYGGGYYDRFLQRRNTLKVGWCYAAQVVEKVPTEKTDVRLNALCTEKYLWQREE